VGKQKTPMVLIPNPKTINSIHMSKYDDHVSTFNYTFSENVDDYRELTAETPAFCTYATSSGVNNPDSLTT